MSETIANVDPAAIEECVRAHVGEHGLRAVLYQVSIDGQPMVANAIGESMTGTPATIEMRFRNGAVAIGYISTLLLVLVDEGVLALDEPIERWLPGFPDATLVTPRMLIQMTAGYPDYVPDETFVRDFCRDPFRHWSADERIEIGQRTLPRCFRPGHELGLLPYQPRHSGPCAGIRHWAAARRVAARAVLDPLGLTGTVASESGTIPAPVLHAYSSERRTYLGIADDMPFIEESTYWNPSWTLAPGSVQTTTIADMTATAVDWGAGSLLSPESHRAQITPLPMGFGAKVDAAASATPSTRSTTMRSGWSSAATGSCRTRYLAAMARPQGVCRPRGWPSGWPSPLRRRPSMRRAITAPGPARRRC